MIRFHRASCRPVLFAVVFAVLPLAACSSLPGSVTSDEGSERLNVFPTNYKPELIAFMQTYLNDPTGVREAQIAEPVLTPVGSSDRYVVCIKYNAKTSEGRYMGVKQNMAVYLRGRFNQLVNATGESCKTAAYQPFPELESLKSLKR
jgi:hypothetical protein